MPQRLAGILSIVAFALCLVVGGIEADNPFDTTICRALVAMAVTFVIGLIVGAMGQRMIKDSMKAEEDKLAELQTKSAQNDR